MKKSLIILFVLCSFLGYNQNSSYSGWIKKPKYSDSDVIAYIAASSGLSETRKDTISLFVAMLKDSLSITNLSDFFEDLHIPQLDSANSLIDMVDRVKDTCYGAVTFTPDLGFNSDGTTGYIKTDFKPSAGSLISLNNATFGSYTNVASGTNYRVIMGCEESSTANRFYSYLTASGVGSAIINATSAVASGSGLANTGCLIATRRASNDIELYMNGVSAASDTDASTGLCTQFMYVLAKNKGGTAQVFLVNQRVAGWFVSLKVTDEQARKITNCLEWYMDAIGSGVIP